MRATVYLIRGGDKKTGYWFLPGFFNHKREAVNRVKFICNRDPHAKKTLKVIKFTSEDL